MKGIQQEIQRATRGVSRKFGKEEMDKVEYAMKKVIKNGTGPKEALGLTDAMIEGIYGQAYRLYNTGKYKDAAQIFRLLLMITSKESKYAMGLAACFHMQKDFKSAIVTYCMVTAMDPKSPVPFYHCADCYIQIGDPFSAVVALETAVKKSEGKPEFKVLQDRATLMAESLKKDITKAQTP